MLTMEQPGLSASASSMRLTGPTRTGREWMKRKQLGRSVWVP
jgi:hypothetical protein